MLSLTPYKTFVATALLVSTLQPLLTAEPEGVMRRLYSDPTPGALTRITGGLRDLDGLAVRLEAVRIPGDLSAVTQDLVLPQETGDGYHIYWWSSNFEVVAPDGKVTRPRSMLEDAEVRLKAILRKGETQAERVFTVKVLKEATSPSPVIEPAIRPVAMDAEAEAMIDEMWGDAFQKVTYPQQFFDFTVEVAPGESIQAALDQAKAAGGGVVQLLPGIHPLTEPVIMSDRITLVGAGRDYTILRKTAEFSGHTLSHAGGAMYDVVLKDFTLDGSGLTGQGINFSSGIPDPDTQSNRIMLQGITVRNVFDHGMATSRISNLIFDDVHMAYNGNHSELFHNLYLLGINKLLISDSILSSPTAGKSLKLTRIKHSLVQRTEMRDGLWNAVQIDDQGRYNFFHRVHIENFGRTALWFICERFGRTETRYTQDSQYAPQHIVINRCELIGNTRGTVFKDVIDARIINSTLDNRESDVVTLRCADQITIEDSTLTHEPEHHTRPEGVPIL